MSCTLCVKLDGKKKKKKIIFSLVYCCVYNIVLLTRLFIVRQHYHLDVEFRKKSLKHLISQLSRFIKPIRRKHSIADDLKIDNH